MSGERDRRNEQARLKQLKKQVSRNRKALSPSESTHSLPSDDVESLSRSKRRQARVLSIRSLWKWFVGTGLTLVAAYFLFFPVPSFDTGYVSDTRPLVAQYRLKNNSPYFSLYDVQPVCKIMELEVEGSKVLKNIRFNNHIDAVPEIEAQHVVDVSCLRSPVPLLESQKPIRADVILEINYRWFWWPSILPQRSTNQRLQLSLQPDGKYIWRWR